MQITFYKYQGTGNDFVMIDDRSLTFPVNNHALVKALCDRRFGIGADGLILLQPHATAAYFMKYYNSDGRESSMCGNGGRCLAAFALHLKAVTGNHVFMATDGLHKVETESDPENNDLMINLKMQDVPGIEQRPDNIYVLNTGSPHFVQFVQAPVKEADVVHLARKIRYNPEFAEAGINVNFVNLLGLHEISMRTYERGVEDETLSCGTGVTAAALATASINNLPAGKHTVNVRTSGGDLRVTFTSGAGNTQFTEVWLKGPATRVFNGTVEI